MRIQSLVFILFITTLLLLMGCAQQGGENGGGGCSGCSGEAKNCRCKCQTVGNVFKCDYVCKENQQGCSGSSCSCQDNYDKSAKKNDQEEACERRTRVLDDDSGDDDDDDSGDES